MSLIKSATKKALNNQKYIASCGNECPFCMRNNIVGKGLFNCDDDMAWREVKCESCGKSWKEIYRLVGYDEIYKRGSHD